MKDTTHWADLMQMHFGVNLDSKIADQWFVELRRNVKHWNYDQIIEGDDMINSPQGLVIHDELCRVLRHTSKLERKPRSDTEHSVYAYNVSDIVLWVNLYRKNNPDHDQQASSTRKVYVTKRIIKHLFERDRLSDAAFSAHNPLHTKEGQIMIGEARVGDVLSPEQCKEMDRYCISLGFDAGREREEWATKNYNRVMEESLKGGVIGVRKELTEADTGFKGE
jgi:hypothetical protein